MFKYFLFVFVLWYQIRRYECVQKDAAPLAVLNAKKYNFSEITEEWKKKPGVAMSGQNNYYVGQQVYYVYSEQQLKRLISDDGNLGYDTTRDIGTHKLHHIKLTWNDARKACIEKGGHLAVINSPAEEKIFRDELIQKNFVNAWLGLHDIFKEGDWVTVLDEPLASIRYVNWSILDRFGAQPDNWGNSQDCAALIREGGMDDQDCGLAQPFFCEIPA